MWCHLRSHLLRVCLLNHHIALVPSCPQQMTSAAIILIAGKTKIWERRKQSKRGAQVSFLGLTFTFMAFPAESEYNEGKGLMISATLHAKLPPPPSLEISGEATRSRQSSTRSSTFTKTPPSSIWWWLSSESSFFAGICSLVGWTRMGGCNQARPSHWNTLYHTIPHSKT